MRRASPASNHFGHLVDSAVPTVRDVLAEVDLLAPPWFAFSFDKCGFQVGDLDSIVTSVVCTLDCTFDAVDFAVANSANVLVAHHPLIWNPLPRVESSSVVGRLIANGISLIAAHTNWDSAPGGINDTLAKLLGLTNVRPFGPRADVPWYKIVTFAPVEQAEKLVSEMSEAGAGRIGLYDRCAFLAEGTGTFLPLAGSDPTIGKQGQVAHTAETRIEMVVPDPFVAAVTSALRKHHCYEEPAFDLVPLKNSLSHPLGRIGEIDSTLSWDELKQRVDTALDTRCLIWKSPVEKVKSVAVIGGAGDSEWAAAHAAGADVLLTGEVRHDVSLNAGKLGFVQAGHFATEHPGMAEMARRLNESGLLATTFEPKRGFSGRPLA